MSKHNYTLQELKAVDKDLYLVINALNKVLNSVDFKLTEIKYYDSIEEWSLNFEGIRNQYSFSLSSLDIDCYSKPIKIRGHSSRYLFTINNLRELLNAKNIFYVYLFILGGNSSTPRIYREIKPFFC